ncbi:MAG: hypothetical protein ACPGWR_09005 [Ardenticatenaceae bacterium]
MVIIKRQNGPVANWWFEDEEEPITYQPNPQKLCELLEICQSVAVVLERYELLRPSMVILADWIDPNSSENKLLEDEPAITVPIPSDAGAGKIVDIVKQALERLIQKREGNRKGLPLPTVYPTTVDVLGTGVVINGAGHKYEFPNVVWLSGAGDGRLAVDVNTQIDAWLPHTLLGEPQPDVYNYNQPRLESALREIQSRLGIVPITDDHNKYVLINGLHLANYMDDDEPMVVVRSPYSQWFRSVLM